GQPPQERPIVGNPAANNPHLGKPDSIRSGMALYRIRCADCHGMDATGYRGPDLTALLATDVSDERLFHTLRKLATPAPAEKTVGNVENGARLFGAQCASCHRVGTRGGRLGPDLSRVGV